MKLPQIKVFIFDHSAVSTETEELLLMRIAWEIHTSTNSWTHSGDLSTL
jgi:hypothetical protein